MLHKIPGHKCVLLINMLYKTSKLSLRTSIFPFLLLIEGFSLQSCLSIYMCIFLNGIHFKSHLALSIVKSWYIFFCTSEATFPCWVTILVGPKALTANRASGSPAPASISFGWKCATSVEAQHKHWGKRSSGQCNLYGCHPWHSKVQEILQEYMVGENQGQFLHALSKLRDVLLLLSFTCSVCIVSTLPSKVNFDDSFSNAWSHKCVVYFQMSFALCGLAGPIY